MPSTARLMRVVAGVAEEVDRVREQRDRTRAQEAPSSTANISAFSTSAIHSARRKRGSTAGVAEQAESEQQDEDMARMRAKEPI